MASRGPQDAPTLCLIVNYMPHWSIWKIGKSGLRGHYIRLGYILLKLLSELISGPNNTEEKNKPPNTHARTQGLPKGLKTSRAGHILALKTAIEWRSICAKGSIANEAVSCWGMIATEEYYWCLSWSSLNAFNPPLKVWPPERVVHETDPLK